MQTAALLLGPAAGLLRRCRTAREVSLWESSSSWVPAQAKLPATPFMRHSPRQHTIYSMNVGLKVTYLYHDIDLVEVRITVENAAFRGSADVYLGTDGLLEAAAVLKGFPRDRQDTREVTFGSAGPKFAGGSVRLEFYCNDLAGHTAFRAVIEEDYRGQSQVQCATLLVDFEPASLDRFLVELQQVEKEHRGSASLIALVI